MAEPVPVHVDYFRIELPDRDGYTFPVVALRDRRSASQPNLRWVFQRHFEWILYKRTDGGSTGVIWKLLNTSGLGRTALAVDKAAVTVGHVLPGEFQSLLSAFKSGLPVDAVDPCSVNKIRVFSLIPLTTAATLARTFGRSDASMAFLNTLSQPIPESWVLQQHAEDEAALQGAEVDD